MPIEKSIEASEGNKTGAPKPTTCEDGTKALSFCCAIGWTPEESSQLLQADEKFLGVTWKPNPDLPPQDQFQSTCAIVGDREYEVIDDNMYSTCTLYKGTSVEEATKSQSMGVEADFSVGYGSFKASANASVKSSSSREEISKSMVFQIGGYFIVRTRQIDLAKINGPEGLKAWNPMLTGENGPVIWMHENGAHFVQKCFVGGRYTFKVEVQFSSAESKSSFEMEVGGGGSGNFGLVSLAASFKVEGGSKSGNLNEKLTVKASMLALGGDTRGVTKALVGANASNVFDLIQQYFGDYLDSMEKNGSVVWLIVRSISPGILQSLADMKIHPMVTRIHTERMQKSFLKLKDCEKWKAVMEEKMNTFRAQLGTNPGAEHFAQHYELACKPIIDKCDDYRAIMKNYMMMQRGAVYEMGRKKGMPIEIGDEQWNPSKDEKEDENKKVAVPEAQKGLINMPPKLLQTDWDNVASMQQDWALLTGYGATAYIPVTTADLADIEKTDLVFWQGPVYKGKPIATPNQIVVLPGDAPLPKEGCTEMEMNEFVSDHWYFSIPGYMYNRRTKKIDYKMGCAQGMSQEFKDAPKNYRNKPYEWDEAKIPRTMLNFMMYYATKTWPVPGFVTVTYEGVWENGRMHGYGVLEFRWDAKSGQDFREGRESEGPFTVTRARGKFAGNAAIGNFQVDYDQRDKEGRFLKWVGPIELVSKTDEMGADFFKVDEKIKKANKDKQRCPWLVKKDGEGVVTFKNNTVKKAVFNEDELKCLDGR